MSTVHLTVIQIVDDVDTIHTLKLIIPSNKLYQVLLSEITVVVQISTNPTFMAVLYKIDIKGFQNQQKQSCLHWELNSQHQPSMD